MKKSNYAKYRKAIKKRFIKKLGRKVGGRIYREEQEWVFGMLQPFMYRLTVKQATEDKIVAYRYEQAHKRLTVKLWLNKAWSSNLIINSPGGEIDPAEGIRRELRMLLAVGLPEPTIYVDPSITAY